MATSASRSLLITCSGVCLLLVILPSLVCSKTIVSLGAVFGGQVTFVGLFVDSHSASCSNPGRAVPVPPPYSYVSLVPTIGCPLSGVISHGLLRIFLNVAASSVNPPNPSSRRSTSASVSRMDIGQEEPPTRSGTYHQTPTLPRSILAIVRPPGRSSSK